MRRFASAGHSPHANPRVGPSQNRHSRNESPRPLGPQPAPRSGQAVIRNKAAAAPKRTTELLPIELPFATQERPHSPFVNREELVIQRKCQERQTRANRGAKLRLDA